MELTSMAPSENISSLQPSSWMLMARLRVLLVMLVTVTKLSVSAMVWRDRWQSAEGMPAQEMLLSVRLVCNTYNDC